VPASQQPNAGEIAEQRRAMVENQIRKRGIDSQLVLQAMQEVPRHEFVPAESCAEAYADKPVVIGAGQTISQPYIVAAMTAALELTGAERVLEVGAGCGYQSAILSLLAREVFSIEVRAPLAAAARERLARLGYANVWVEIGDGTLGWPDAAPFDGILVAAATPEIPPPLVEQLAEGGRLVIPVGNSEDQELRQLRKVQGRIIERTLTACRFVPLVGRYGWPPNS
jgi:protein-L-isoaspartate(D-aspartate) O-methyltransferase